MYPNKTLHEVSIEIKGDESVEEIAKNEYYLISVDKNKNRIYLTVQGFWNDPSVVPNYIDDIAKAASSTTQSFTVITDVTQMKPPSPEVGELHMKAQTTLVEKGLSATAEILPASVIAQASVDRYSKESGMNKGSFATIEEAEKWLDEI